MNKPLNNKAWFLILPVFLCVAFSAILPLMTVVNYSVQDIISPEQHVFVGVDWFRQILRDGDLQDALTRQLIFSLCVLAVEIPLGIGLALSMPSKGWKASAALVVLAMPLLIPWNVVGTIWQIFGRSDIGLAGYWLNQMGIDYNYTSHSFDAWITVLIMDVWHWTPLVVLLCYAGLRAIPDAYYQAAKIDGATHTQIYFQIILRLVAPVLAVMALLSFIGTFSDYILASIVFSKTEQQTVAVGLGTLLNDPYSKNWAMFCAGALIAATPIVALFLGLQRYIVSGLTGGAVKG